MKLHNLANKIKIVKETDKAVFIKSKEMSEEDYKTVEEIWLLGINIYIKKDGFWLPKSHIEITDGFVTKITLWLYNKLSNDYWDFSTILEEEKVNILKGEKKYEIMAH